MDVEDYYLQDSIVSFQPVEYYIPTDVVTVCNSGKLAVFWFQLGTDIWDSETIYFWSKFSDQRVLELEWNFIHVVGIIRGVACCSLGKAFRFPCQVYIFFYF